MSDNITQPNNNEIDLFEILIKLWQEKLIIICTTLAITIISMIYAYQLTPIYLVNAQISPPTEADLSQFEMKIDPEKVMPFIYTPGMAFRQQQELMSLSSSSSSSSFDKKNSPKIKTDIAFTKFLAILESHSHILSLAYKNQKLIKEALNINIDDNLIKNITELRVIEFPNTIDKISELAPDRYSISIMGSNREALRKLLTIDLKIASESTTQQIKNFLINQTTKKLNQKIIQQRYIIETLQSQINARKSYLLSTRHDRIIELEAAAKIAATLNIKEPLISLFDKEKDTTPLYLQGEKLLHAKIGHLKKLKDNIFIDDDLQSMKAQIVLVKNDQSIIQFKEEKEKLLNNTSILNFSNVIFNAPEKPIKPKKSIIVSIGIILGSFIGLLLAITKIAVNNKLNAT